MKTDLMLPLVNHNTSFMPPFAAISSNTGELLLPVEVQSALNHVLGSNVFRKARTMSRLLRFLVEKALSGDARETSEYAIGIGVFDRNCATYSTCDDPTVRVQIGRLRDKLAAYYADAGAHTDLRFIIPVGSYMPKIQKATTHAAAKPQNYLLAVMPLLHLSQDPQGAAFTDGLNEELTCQLFKTFGDKVVTHKYVGPATVIPSGVRHLLEGSIRVSGDLVRASLRLIDASVGCIAWSEQFDYGGPFGIAVQEQVAVGVCGGLKGYFSHV
ncbi:hypothetical protein ACVBEF_02805 [Glaciimonas sp. GG7]